MGEFILRLSKGPTDAADDRASDGWVALGSCRARVANDDCGSPAALVRGSHGLAVGSVRLDNRWDISRLAECDPNLPDLAIMVAALDRHGESCVRRFVGDFGFAYWDDRKRTLIAARDAFGVRSVFYHDGATTLTIGSHAASIGAEQPLSLDYIADYVAYNASALTPFANVLRIRQGTYHVIEGDRRREHVYWSPYVFDTDWNRNSRDAIEEFRALFEDAVRTCLEDGSGCWAHLSGGLDSSSIVSMACALATADPRVRRLGGTVTMVDSFGDADERQFSDAVVDHWSVRNEQFKDIGMWHDDGSVPMPTDEPDPAYPFFARDQPICRLIRSTGGRTVLSGQGSDHYLGGTYSYLANRVALGQISRSIRELYRLAVLGRVSFWQLARENAIEPLIYRKPQSDRQWPKWVQPSFARRFPIAERNAPIHDLRGPRRRLFVTGIANALAAMEYTLHRGVWSTMLDVRYPFLYRPLVELCMQLPPELIIQFRQRKFILREALRGILPEKVRQRKTKSYIDGRIQRSLIAQRPALCALLEQSLTGEMGCIDVRQAQDALSKPFDSANEDSAQLRHLLTLETWLAVRSGRWTTAGSMQDGCKRTTELETYAEP
jgi:asparagine synthase (glutamine-hydrolysing)